MSADIGSTNVGKVASALLTKHVRTLEVLYSLQRENARIRRDNQANFTEEDVLKRIDDAVAAAVIVPNEAIEELQSQVEKLQEEVRELEDDLTSAKEAARQSLKQASSQTEKLRVANQKGQLKAKCSDLESEEGRNARNALLEKELELKLKTSAATLAAEEERADSLARRLREREREVDVLQLRLEEKDKDISLAQAGEAALRVSAGESQKCVADIEHEVGDLKARLDAGETAKSSLEARLGQALREGERVRKEVAGRAGQEQDLRAKLGERTTRAEAAEAKLAEERKRSSRLREEGKRRIQELALKHNETLTGYNFERDELLARVDELSHEVLALRAHMSNNKSQFSKYVEAKTENSQLKEEIDELKVLVAAPRPPNRISGTHSTTSSNKYVSVDRLRHSISVARSTNNAHSSSGGTNKGVSVFSAGYQGSSSSSLLREGGSGGRAGEVAIPVSTQGNNSSKIRLFLHDPSFVGDPTNVGAANSARSASIAASSVVIGGPASRTRQYAPGGANCDSLDGKNVNTRRHSVAGGEWASSTAGGRRAPGYELSVPT